MQKVIPAINVELVKFFGGLHRGVLKAYLVQYVHNKIIECDQSAVAVISTGKEKWGLGYCFVYKQELLDNVFVGCSADYLKKAMRQFYKEGYLLRTRNLKLAGKPISAQPNFYSLDIEKLQKDMTAAGLGNCGLLKKEEHAKDILKGVEKLNFSILVNHYPDRADLFTFYKRLQRAGSGSRIPGILQTAVGTPAGFNLSLIHI